MILEFIEIRMKKCFDFFISNISKINVNRLLPTFFDTVTFSFQGTLCKVNSVAYIKSVDLRTLIILPYESKNLRDIYIGLNSIKNLNVTFSLVESKEILVRLPPLTEQTRLLFIKKVKEEEELVKISIRNVRREGNDKVKVMVKSKEIDKSLEKVLQDKIQVITDNFIKNISVEATKKIEKLNII